MSLIINNHRSVYICLSKESPNKLLSLMQDCEGKRKEDCTLLSKKGLSASFPGHVISLVHRSGLGLGLYSTSRKGGVRIKAS